MEPPGVFTIAIFGATVLSNQGHDGFLTLNPVKGAQEEITIPRRGLRG